MGEELITEAIRKMVEAGSLAGAATLVWQDGKVIQAAGVGWRDIASKLPIERNTLFRIASMTKPITSTLALMLFDEGRFALSDPITRWAPEFSQMRVLRSSTATLDQTDPAERPVTFEDLLTHRSGLTYGDWHPGPIAQAYKDALGADIDSELLPDDWIARLAALPLIDQPGTAFHYGHSTDLLGLLIARMENAPLGDVLKRRIFDPLGMDDTGFTVPLEKQPRRAGPYGFDEVGQLCERLTGPGGSFLPERPEGMAYVSGGQGLWSTVDDYLTFARMFLNAGTVNGYRLLQPGTFRRMVTNCLNENQRVKARWILDAGHGFGLGVAMVLDPLKAGPRPCGGGVGAVGWPGAFGGWWRADPNNNAVLIFLAHNMLELEQLTTGIGLGVFDAITEFQAQASSLLR
ncbi:MAG TPA: serine hydrolase domain-containing protein [Anaerolineales bacterium]|nr:serine hydrolase domain-containing protein [Anaerolineales bacterium]